MEVKRDTLIDSEINELKNLIELYEAKLELMKAANVQIKQSETQGNNKGGNKIF